MTATSSHIFPSWLFANHLPFNITQSQVTKTPLTKEVHVVSFHDVKIGIGCAQSIRRRNPILWWQNSASWTCMCLQQTASHVTVTITVERKVIWTKYSWEIIKNNTYFILAIITYEGVFLREFPPCTVLNDIIYRSKYNTGLFKWNCFGGSSGHRSGAHKKSP